MPVEREERGHVKLFYGVLDLPEDQSDGECFLEQRGKDAEWWA